MVEISLPDKLVDLVGEDVFAAALDVVARSVETSHGSQGIGGRQISGYGTCRGLFHTFLCSGVTPNGFGCGVTGTFAAKNPASDLRGRQRFVSAYCEDILRVKLSKNENVES